MQLSHSWLSFLFKLSETISIYRYFLPCLLLHRSNIILLFFQEPASVCVRTRAPPITQIAAAAVRWSRELSVVLEIPSCA